MLQIVLVRPGATDYDEQGRIQGSLDIPLNKLGESQVEGLIADLRPLGLAALYTAPCEPATQTAEKIGGELGLKVKKLDRVRNLNFGLWQGMLIDEVKRKHPKVYRQWQEQPESICPPGGEMLSEVAERVETALAKLLKRHKEGAIAIVAPEPLASLIRGQIDHKEMGDLWRAAAEHAAWEIFQIDPQLTAQS